MKYIGILTILVLCLCAQSVFGAETVTGYIHKYSFDSGYVDVNGTAHMTSSGGALNTTVVKENNASYNPLNAGYANYSSTHGISTGNQEASMCAWIYPTSLTDYGNLFGFGSNTPTGGLFAWLGRSDGTVYFGGQANDYEFTGYKFGFNTWNHGCMVYVPGSKTVVLYLNGTNVANGTLAANENFNANGIFAGGRAGTSGGKFNIDDFRIYARSLTAAEVLSIYQNPPNSSGGGVADSLTYSGMTHNSTRSAYSTNFSINLASGGTHNLTSCMPTLDNGGGVFVNQTPIALSGQSKLCSFQATLNATENVTVRYYFTFNSTNSSGTMTNVSTTGSFTTTGQYRTPNGTLNYTKYPYPVTATIAGDSYPLNGCGTGFIEGNVIYHYFAKNESNRIWLSTSTNVYNLSTNYTALPVFNGYDVPYILVDSYGRAQKLNSSYIMFNIVQLGGGGTLHQFRSTNRINWTDYCGGGITIPGTSSVTNPAVYYENSTGIMHMVLGHDFSGDLKATYYTSTDEGCTWTSTGVNFEDYDTEQIGYFNGTWIAYMATAPSTGIKYLRGSNLSAMTVNQTVTTITEAWEGAGPITDADWIIVPPESQQYFPFKFMHYYLGNQQVEGLQYDTENRSFYEVHDVLPGIAYNATSGGEGGSSYVAPNVTGARISPTTAYTGTQLVGYCNATSDYAITSYAYQWYKNSTLNASGTVKPTYSWCYQETANVSTSCGGLSTGTYYASGVWDVTNPASNAYDGDWLTTYTFANSSTTGNATLFINYTVPNGASLNTSKWQVRYDIAGTSYYVNNTFLTGTNNRCAYNVDLMQFKIISNKTSSTKGELDLLCFNGTDWQFGLIGVSTSTGDIKFFEEAMFWNMTNASGNEQTLTQIDGGIVTKAQNWTFACQVTDTTNTSAWRNSTSLLISNTAPVSTYAAQNTTFNHNVSSIFGDACTDIDPETLTYTTNNTNLPILANGSINYTANITKTGFYSLNVSCSDGTANTTSTMTVNITNTAPTIAGIQIQPITGALNCTYEYADNDTDPESGSTYKWYKNNTLIAGVTSKTIASGNYSTNDSIKCQITASDGLAVLTAQNSSPYINNDLTPPVINDFSLDASSVTSGTQILFTTNCTDENSVGRVVLEMIDPNLALYNYTMTFDDGNRYTKAFTTSIIGIYSARTFCSDGTNNIANTNYTPFSVSQAQTGAGGGGGSDTTIILQGGNATTYEFEKRIVDGGVTLLWDHTEPNRVLKYYASTSRPTKTCEAEAPIVCTVVNNGTEVELSITLKEYDFFLTTFASKVTAQSYEGDLTTTNAQFRVVNFAYGVPPRAQIHPPSAFAYFPYLIKVNSDGTYGGIRIVAFTIGLFVLIWAIRKSIGGGR